MSNLFKTGGTTNSPQMPATSIRVQSSILGKPIPIVYGKNRLAGNVIWSDSGATFTQVASPQGGGGKGGSAAGGGKGGSSSSYEYTYALSVLIAFCEGPASAANPNLVWYGKAVEVFSTANLPGTPAGIDGELNLGYVNGSYGQGVLPYLATNYPAQALAYRGICYIPSTPMYLGGSNDLPQISCNINGMGSFAIGSFPDATFPFIINDFLTNQYYGLGYPASRLDTTMMLYTNYTLANVLLYSPIVADQRAASDYLNEWMQASNSEFVFSSGVLKVVPYGDTEIVGPYATYTPPAVTPYIIDDFYMPSGDDPITVVRKRLEDVNNTVQIEYLDAYSGTTAMQYYNPTIAEAKDDSLIDLTNGTSKIRPVQQFYGFTYPLMATLAASLLLSREQILNTYTFTVSRKYILLDPMDIVRITDPVLGLQAYPVRIREISENTDYTLTIIAEDFLEGAAFSPAFASEPRVGIGLNYNADPGLVNTPLIFEPTDELAGELDVWIAISGQDQTEWGGCEVWASYDGVTYQKVGTQRGNSRMGVLTTNFFPLTPPVQGEAIDTTQTLDVDFTESSGVLASGSLQDVIAFNTLMYIGDTGEYVSWRDATPFGTHSYHLGYLNRTGYGTSSLGTAAVGTPVCRIDGAIFKFPYTQDRIGSTVYIKFLSFNRFGGGRKSLDQVGAYAYTILGTALTSPLPDVQNFVSSYVGNITYLDWDPVSDFRPVQYELRKGANWDTAQFIGTVAHSHIPAVGDGLYWVSATSQPVAGLRVYSENPQSWNVVGSVLTLNLLESADEGPSGGAWPGTLTGQVFNDGTFIRTPQTLTSIPTKLDTTSISPANAALTNNNLTFSVTNPSASGIEEGARSIFSASTGKLYCEFTINAASHVSPTWIGLGIGTRTGAIVNDATPPAIAPNYLGSNVNGAVLRRAGTTTIAGVILTIFPNPCFFAGDTVSMAADIDNKKIWWRVNGGNWNNSPTDNPATNTGGSSIAAMSAGPYYVYINLEGSTEQVTVNFGATAFKYAMPSGYDIWGYDFGAGAYGYTPLTGIGYYTVPPSHIVNNGRLAPLLVQIIFGAAGEGSLDFFHPGPPDDNDIFAHTDIFDTAAGRFIDVYPEIQLSTDGINFGNWQRYQPGFYNAWKINARMYISSLDPVNVSAVLTSFIFATYAETRVDHPLVSTTIDATGRTITFAPDGQAAAAFNGGPNGGTISPSAGLTIPAPSIPAVRAEIMNTVAHPKSPGDDTYISSVTLSGCTIQAKNSGGTGIQRDVTLQVWGF